MKTDTELHELDAWIAEHVMGWRVHCRNTSLYVAAHEENGLMTYAMAEVGKWSPTTKGSDAIEVLKKCAGKLDCEDMRMGLCTDNWTIQSVYRENPGERGRVSILPTWPEEQSLELAICLFAKELFSK